jgi:hypothetical protein
MFSLLLPLDPNAERHDLYETGPSPGFWVRIFHAVLDKVQQFTPRGD